MMMVRGCEKNDDGFLRPTTLNDDDGKRRKAPAWHFAFVNINDAFNSDLFFGYYQSRSCCKNTLRDYTM